MWDEVNNKANAIGGGTVSSSKTKKKDSLRRECKKMGGGLPPEDLNDTEIKILSVIRDTVIDGHSL